MFKYVLKRIGLAFVTVFVILSITFMLVKALPLDKVIGGQDKQIPYFDAQVRYGYCLSSTKPLEQYGEPIYSYTDSATKSTYYYYQVPIIKQYYHWLRNIVTEWDWGVSRFILPGAPATAIIMMRIPYSIKLNIFSVIFSVPLGLLLGIWAALKKNSMTDHVISTLVMVFISIPSFVLISFIVKIFAYDLGWLPPFWPSQYATAWTRIKGFVIPVFCLSFGSVCGYCRFTRAELCEVMESDYLLLARTKGLTRSQAIIRHALKNAMVPIFPSILAEVIGLLGGSMILEKLYCIPGIGSLFVEALSTYKDYDVLFVDMAIFTTISLLSGVVIDLSYGFIDPRIRMGAKK